LVKGERSEGGVEWSGKHNVLMVTDKVMENKLMI
jgi:hypothetical protein